MHCGPEGVEISCNSCVNPCVPNEVTRVGESIVYRKVLLIDLVKC